MKRKYGYCLALLGLNSIMPAAYAGPPDVVASDSYGNTAMGSYASQSNATTTLSLNTAAGQAALNLDTTGQYNTAVGTEALYSVTTGSSNTGIGESALGNDVQSNNTAIGFEAMLSNDTGYSNTALGAYALIESDSGDYNVAVGYKALVRLSNSISNPAALDNTAVGANTLISNQGSNNVALGYQAITANTSGNDNTAVGAYTMPTNTTGQENVSFGENALDTNVSGSDNIAIGPTAGYAISGSNNIDIGNNGMEKDVGIIRIGTARTQTAVYIAGIDSSRVTGSAVFVTSTGKLGVLASSERYKSDIAAMSRADKLDGLRPVAFHLKADPKGPLQYGLIAEQVAHVYPDLVIRDDEGVIQGVRYDELAPLLLAAMQQEGRRIDEQGAEIRALREHLSKLAAERQTGAIR